MTRNATGSVGPPADRLSPDPRVRRAGLEPACPASAASPRADWESALWQRQHTVKNLKEFKAASSATCSPRRLAEQHRAGSRGAGDDVDADSAAHAQHHERGAICGRIRCAATWRRPLTTGVTDWPNHPQASRDSLHEARHVEGGGADPSLPDQGAGRDALDLPAVLRPLHPHGPGRQRRAAGGQAQVRHSPEGAAPADPRLPAEDAVGARRRGLRRRHRQPAHHQLEPFV